MDLVVACCIRMLDQVRLPEDWELLEEYICDAAFLLEKQSAGWSGPAPEDYGRGMGWSEPVIGSTATPEELALMKAALIRFIREERGHPLWVSAIWALGKSRGDRNLVPLLVVSLRHCLEHNPEGVYQVLISLQNLGEATLPVPGGSSCLQIERNCELARKYLKRRGRS